MLLRKRAGLTQQQVADALGVSRVTVSNWEMGRYGKEPVKLSVRQTKTLCALLGVTLEELPDDFGASSEHEE